MDSDSRSFYDVLGFELVEIDNREVWFLELHDYGDYATITDEEGDLPSSLYDKIIWAVYDQNDSFQWSVTLDDSMMLKEYFDRSDDINDILKGLEDLRMENMTKAYD